MPQRNRVSPLGELVTAPDRGLVYGNRGCLHDANGVIRRAFAGRRWIACRLAFRDRRRQPLVQPGRYTELFFLDDATALAAGHRACAECRRPDYARLIEVLGGGADEVDARLHEERLVAGTRKRRLHDIPLRLLPDGAFVLHAGVPHLVLGDALLPWSTAGYGPATARPARSTLPVVTPPSLVSLLARGWDPLVPLLHPSAQSG